MVLGYEVKQGIGQKESWSFDGPIKTRETYEGQFEDLILELFPGANIDRYFESFLSAQRENGFGANVLDLMGGAYFIENQGAADSLTGLRFGPFDRSQLPEGYSHSKVPTEVLGDILNLETWKKLDLSMAQRGIDSMDLIVLNPVGGWRPFNSSFDLTYGAFQETLKLAAQRLSSNGHMYFLIEPQNYFPAQDFDSAQVRETTEQYKNHPTHKLILKPKFTTNGNSLYGFTGALIPK